MVSNCSKMKFQNIFFYIIALILLASCTRDSPPSEPTILGRWYYNRISVDGIIYPYTGHETCGRDFIEFLDTNEVLRVNVQNCTEVEDWIGPYFINGYELAIFNGNFVQDTDITRLDFDQLGFEYFVDTDANGIVEHYIEYYDRY